MTNSDYKHFVTSAPSKVAGIYRNYRHERAAALNDPMLPAAGQLYRAGELQKQALKEAEGLAEKMETAAILARKELLHQRDQKQPKIDPQTLDRRGRQLLYLHERGVTVEQMLRDYGNTAENLMAIADQAEFLARAESPVDRQAAEGVQAIIEQKAYEAFSDQYRQAADAVRDWERQHYRARVAVNNVIRELRAGNSDSISVPDTAEGRMIDA